MGSIYGNRKYLVSVKNRLIYLFTFRDSKEVLEDLNDYALESSEDLEEKYGSPKTFLNRLHEETLPDKKIINLRIMGLLLIIISFFAVNRFVSGTFEALLYGLLLITTYIVLSGDDCLLGIIRITRKERIEYMVTQSLMFFIILVAQFFTAFVIPKYTYENLENDAKLFLTGKIVHGLSVLFVGVVLLIIVYGLMRYLRKQQVWMFGIVIQGLGMILSLCQYNSFVGNLTVKTISPYLLLPCFVCFFFSVIWFGLFLRKREEYECSD